ncbi:MAG: hypothetical protein BWK74_06030 [Desulfobacteraceae bacterium A6]|nr:MAG: hypothetical protein BWK74_06030 [Desulfobacteraceae bacterium A6]
MKTILVVILLVAIALGAGYLGLPVLIEKETAVLKADVQDLKQKLQKIEEESKIAPLQQDSDIQKVIKTVNAMYPKVVTLEDSFKKSTSSIDETINKQKAMIEEALKKQAETIEKFNKEAEAKILKSMFNALMANIRGHVLKVKVELVAKNIGSAKNELGLIDEAFEKAKTSASEESRKVIEELKGTLKKAKEDIDIDLPAASNRIDLLWHEMSKLLRKA